MLYVPLCCLLVCFPSFRLLGRVQALVVVAVSHLMWRRTWPPYVVKNVPLGNIAHVLLTVPLALLLNHLLLVSHPI